IGFFIWNTNIKKNFKRISADIYNSAGNFIFKKNVWSYDDSLYINEWLKKLRNTQNLEKQIGILNYRGNDFQHESYIFIDNLGAENSTKFSINLNNLVDAAIYLSVRKAVKPTWLNDRDQFLYPNKKWEKDIEFHNDCLAYTLFNNNIYSKHGVNHWIPFKEGEVNARTEFESHFMISFLSGKIVKNAYTADLFEHLEPHKNKSKTNWEEGKKREFSIEAQAVFDAGRELWKYYHTQKNVNVNASLYDIREYFQGRNDKGKMNNKSDDEKYNELIGALRESLDILAKKIEPKVYEYEFLMR
ncbi:MAG: hypothetical protein LBG92_04165, partial [Prevotellaceae bacterium]|nr:hypothetical protein [Prevotellaceae bacterium]